MKLETTVSYVYEKKEGGRFIETYRSEDEPLVYSGLGRCLIAKKLDECTWIKRIAEKQRCDSFRTIVVYEDNGSRRIYTIRR